LVHPDVGDTDSVTWSVSPAGAATITGTNCGAIVTGQFAGIGNYFTVSAKFNTGEATNSNIKVKIPTIDVTGADSVLVGKTAQLTATVSPKYKDEITVNWTSSDTKIATVDANGVVTGVANGPVRITATASDDNRITASKEITVKAPDLTVSGPGTVAVGKTITLTAKVGPDEVTDKTVTWKSSDETIATVDKDGKVTGKKAGDVKITAASNAYKNLTVEVPVKVTAAVYLYYGNGSHFNGIHAMPFVSSDLWAGGAGVNVIINGVPLVPGRDFSCYSSPHGMIGVTVNPGLLRLLPQNAWHSIEIVSANGVAAGSFSTGYFGYYNIYGVKTGDDSTPLLWAALCLLGISGAGIILAKSRKRKA
ncbi:MAG: Ig domain-containing protein, partial [Oscillospiraceae bacterium]|nr:Ig domain-containing protein [Oscillospiraceae bacterium]